MKLYVAAPWAKKAAAVLAKRRCEARGFRVVSTWTEQPDSEDAAFAERSPVDYALSDWRELCDADALLLLFPQVVSMGKATEFGAALALSIPVIIVGDDGTKGRNIFYHLPGVEFAVSIDEALNRLRDMTRTMD